MIVKNLLVDILSDCNLDCSYCYQTKQGMLTPDEVVDIIEAYDCHGVDIGGGEPALYPRIDELVKRILEKKSEVRISTNGTILLESLFWMPEKEKSNISIQVSLPSLDPEIYARITGKDYVDGAIGNLEIYAKEFDTNVNSVFTDDNISGIQEIIDYCAEKNIPLKLSPAINIRSNKPLLSWENMMRLKNAVLGNSIAGNGVLYSAVREEFNSCRFYEVQFGLLKTNPCLSDTGKSVYVSPDGDVGGCQYESNRAASGQIKTRKVESDE